MAAEIGSTKPLEPPCRRKRLLERDELMTVPGNDSLVPVGAVHGSIVLVLFNNFLVSINAPLV